MFRCDKMNVWLTGKRGPMGKKVILKGMSLILEFDEARIQSIEDILFEELIDAGMHQATLTDTSGNIIGHQDDGYKPYDTSALSILAASNIGSLNAMSKLLGEDEFPLFILKGKSDNIYFNKVTEDLFLLTIFSHELSLGFVRIKIGNAVKSIKKLIEHCTSNNENP